MNEDPAGCQRWISRKEIRSAKIVKTNKQTKKTQKSKDSLTSYTFYSVIDEARFITSRITCNT